MRYRALSMAALGAAGGAAVLAGSIALMPGDAHGQAAQGAKRVQVTGEVVETWCSVSAIMFAYGTAHHQCAAWCTAGGIPVALKDAAGNIYLILKLGDDESNVASPRMAKFLSHDVSVDGDLIERDGVKYLIVSTVSDDKGVVNQTHDVNGIVPFGN